MVTFESASSPDNASVLRDADKSVVSTLVTEGYAPLTARVLAARALHSAELLRPDLQSLSGVAETSAAGNAAKAIAGVIADGKKICVCGDFDADGVCGTALLKLGLDALDADCEYLVASHDYPDRSLDAQMVRKAKDLGAHMIITVDCGVSAHRSVALAKQLGMQVVVTDHHLASEPVQADHVVNPHLPGSGMRCQHICGTVVAMLLLREIYRRSGSRQRASRYLDLAAVATVADVMPLSHPYNRALIIKGLGMIRKGRCRPLFKAFLESRGNDSCTSSTVSHYLAPMLNCAHRMGKPELGIAALLADDISTARAFASELNALNRERKLLQKRMSTDATRQVAHPVEGAVVVHDDSWSPGVVGLVAGDLARKFQVPAAAFTRKNGRYRCSIRTSKNISVQDTLEQLDKEQPSLIATFGGHHNAGGAVLNPGEESLQLFAEQFKKLCAAGSSLHEEHLIDARPNAEELSHEAVAQLENMPWGSDQPAPVFESSFIVRGTRETSTGHMHQLELDGKLFPGWSDRFLGAVGSEVLVRFSAVTGNDSSPMLMVKEES